MNALLKLKRSLYNEKASLCFLLDAYPGLWEVPLVAWTDDFGYPCSMIDQCREKERSPEDVFDLMMRNFLIHYKTNKAPFPMFAHSAYFDHPALLYRFEGEWIIYNFIFL